MAIDLWSWKKGSTAYTHGEMAYKKGKLLESNIFKTEKKYERKHDKPIIIWKEKWKPATLK